MSTSQTVEVNQHTDSTQCETVETVETIEHVETDEAVQTEQVSVTPGERPSYEVVFFARYYESYPRPSEEEITKFFNNYGTVHHVKCPDDKEYAFVFMTSLSTTEEHRRTRATITQIIKDMTPETKFRVTVASSNRPRYNNQGNYGNYNGYNNGYGNNYNRPQSNTNYPPRQQRYNNYNNNYNNSNYNQSRNYTQGATPQGHTQVAPQPDRTQVYQQESYGRPRGGPRQSNYTQGQGYNQRQGQNQGQGQSQGQYYNQGRPRYNNTNYNNSGGYNQERSNGSHGSYRIMTEEPVNRQQTTRNTGPTRVIRRGN